MQIYFFTFVRYHGKEGGEKCEVLIKERINPPFKSWGTIVPIHFSDSLQLISPKRVPQLKEDCFRYRIITCTLNDELVLLFKTTDDEWMITLILCMAKYSIDIVFHRWNDLEKKYLRVPVEQLTAVEERFVCHILRSISIRSGQKCGYCFM